MGTSNIPFQLSFHDEPTLNTSHFLFLHLPAVCLRPSESWPSHLSVYWQAAWSFSKHAESWLLFPKFQTDICIQQDLGNPLRIWWELISYISQKFPYTGAGTQRGCRFCWSVEYNNLDILYLPTCLYPSSEANSPCIIFYEHLKAWMLY